MPFRETTRRRETRRPVLMALSAVFVAGFLLVVAYSAVTAHASAVAQCIDLSAGGRAYFLFVVLPFLSVALLLAAGTPMALLYRRSVVLAVLVSLVAVGVVLVWFLAGTPGYIRSLTGPEDFSCPGGTPAGWPAWLDR